MQGYDSIPKDIPDPDAKKVCDFCAELLVTTGICGVGFIDKQERGGSIAADQEKYGFIYKNIKSDFLIICIGQIEERN